jgi:hypothetical protein
LGPCFIGGGNSELSAYNQPFNGDGNCWSYANLPGYRIPVDGGGTNMLTNNKDMKFTITELEVWEITYLERDTEGVEIYLY